MARRASHSSSGPTGAPGTLQMHGAGDHLCRRDEMLRLCESSFAGAPRQAAASSQSTAPGTPMHTWSATACGATSMPGAARPASCTLTSRPSLASPTATARQTATPVRLPCCRCCMCLFGCTVLVNAVHLGRPRCQRGSVRVSWCINVHVGNTLSTLCCLLQRCSTQYAKVGFQQGSC